MANPSHRDLLSERKELRERVEELEAENRLLRGGRDAGPSDPSTGSGRRAFLEHLVVAAVQHGGSTVLSCRQVVPGVMSPPSALRSLHEARQCIEWGLREMSGESIDYNQEHRAFMARHALGRMPGDPKQTLPLGRDGKELPADDDLPMTREDHESVLAGGAVDIPDDDTSLDAMAPLPDDVDALIAKELS